MLWANRFSHLSSSSLSCSCYSFGHSPRPWRPRASNIHPFWGLLKDSSDLTIRRATGGTWLAGNFVGILREQALKLHRQMGIQEDPRCNSPQVAVGTTVVGNWGSGICSASTWAHIQCPLTLVLPCTLFVPNRGIVTFHVVQMEPQTLPRQNSFTSTVSTLGEEWTTSFSTSVLFGPVLGHCSDPDMTVPK